MLDDNPRNVRDVWFEVLCGNATTRRLRVDVASNDGLVQRRVSHSDGGTTLDGYFIATRWANDGIVQTLMTERSLRFLHSRVSCARHR